MALFLPILVGLVVGAADARELVDRVAAVVEGDVIALTEVYDLGAEYIEGRASEGGTARRAAELEVLEELIDRALVDQEVVRLGLEVTEEELDRAIDDVARQNGINRQRLQHEVERSGMDWPLYRSEVEQQLRFMKFNQTVILPRVNIPEDELSSTYRQRYVESAGEDCLVVAADDPDSPYAALDTEFGNFLPGELLPEMDTAIFSIGVGQVTEPLESSGGIFLLRVAALLPAEIPPYEEAREQLMLELQSVKGEQELALWATQARRRSSVEIRLAPPRL